MSAASPATPESEQDPAESEEADASRGEFALTLLSDLVLPIGLYYVLRGAGMATFPALLLSGAPPALHTLYTMVRHRRVDTIGVFVLSLVVLGAAVSLISGDPRTVLIRGGVLSAAISLWILSTLFAARPFTYRALEALLPRRRTRLERHWHGDAAFRRVWRGLTVMWGSGLLLDAVLRIIMAYTLPIDSVPVLEGILYAVTWILLQIVSQVVLRRTGTFAKIFDPQRSEPPPVGATQGTRTRAGGAG